MIKSLNIFMENCNGNIYAYKNPKGKNAALAEYIVDTCQRQGRLFNNKLSIASSGRFAVEVAKVCKQRGINFLPILGKFEDPVSFNQITALGFSIDRTPAQEKEDAIARLRNEGWYYFDQFSDLAMIEYYKQEAQKAVSEFGRVPDVFIDFMGSGATMRGFYEILKNSCQFGFSNSCYRDDKKYEKKPFIRDLVKNQNIQLIDVQGNMAGHLAFRYQNGDFGVMGNAARTFFTSVQGAINWLQMNPGKTVLLYWED